MMTIKYGLLYFFFELTDNDGQNFLSAIVLTRHVRTQHKDNGFHGKRNIAKFTRSTILGVQLKSGDN
jgi:hypothetical protein